MSIRIGESRGTTLRRGSKGQVAWLTLAIFAHIYPSPLFLTTIDCNPQVAEQQLCSDSNVFSCLQTLDTAVVRFWLTYQISVERVRRTCPNLMTQESSQVACQTASSMLAFLALRRLLCFLSPTCAIPLAYVLTPTYSDAIRVLTMVGMVSVSTAEYQKVCDAIPSFPEPQLNHRVLLHAL